MPGEMETENELHSSTLTWRGPSTEKWGGKLSRTVWTIVRFKFKLEHPYYAVSLSNYVSPLEYFPTLDSLSLTKVAPEIQRRGQVRLLRVQFLLTRY